MQERPCCTLMHHTPAQVQPECWLGCTATEQKSRHTAHQPSHCSHFAHPSIRIHARHIRFASTIRFEEAHRCITLHFSMRTLQVWRSVTLHKSQCAGAERIHRGAAWGFHTAARWRMNWACAHTETLKEAHNSQRQDSSRRDVRSFSTTHKNEHLETLCVRSLRHPFVHA